MNLPRGIINIITDYAHILFYIEELKDKTKDILEYCNSCYYYKGYTSGTLNGREIKFYGVRFEIQNFNDGWSVSGPIL